MGEHYKAEIIASIPSERADLALPRGRLHRPLPRPARAVDRQAQGLQADQARRRVLARRLEATRCSSASTAPRGRRRRTSTPTCTASRRPRSATTASSGAQLDLFHLQDEAPGMVFWHPKGWSIWQEVEQYMRRVYRDNGYQEVRGAADPRPHAVGALRPLGELQGQHVHDGVGEARLRDQADELPGPRADLQLGPAELPRPAAALRRVRRVPPQRALGRAARDHARARVHAGRRPHLLQPGADPARVRRLQPPRARRLPGLRLRPTSRSSSRCGPRSGSAATTSGTAPRTRCATRSRPAAPSGPSSRAKARSTARRSSTT